MTVKELKERLKHLPEDEEVYIEFAEYMNEDEKKKEIKEIEIPIDTSTIQDEQLKRFVDQLKIYEWIEYEQDGDGITFIDSADIFKSDGNHTDKFFFNKKG